MSNVSFRKGQATKQIPTAFFRVFAVELDTFPEKEAIYLSTDLLQRFSPDTLVIGRFKDQREVIICEKMLRFPFLGERLSGSHIGFAHGLNLAYEKHNLNMDGVGQPLFLH